MLGLKFVCVSLLFTIINCQEFNEFDKNYHKRITENVRNFTRDGLTEKCADFLNMDNMDNKKLRALTQMFDSGGLEMSGLIGGNVLQLGHFDECLKLTSSYSGEKYTGKYCLGNEQSYNTKKFSNVHIPVYITYRYGKCLPSFCTAEDFQKIYKYDFSEQFCSIRNENGLPLKARVTIYILSAFVILAICSTLYELYCILFNRDPKQEICVAFSIIRNSKAVFKSTSNPDQLLCLNGLKALSMMYIVFFHEFQNIYLGPVVNILDISQYLHSKINMFYFQAPIAVDTFFTVAGLITMYNFCKQYDRTGKHNSFMSFLHRYLRLTPSLAVMVLLHACLLEYVSDGPLHGNAHKILVQKCEKYWWSPFLYAQNYINPMEDCVPQSWYLSVDMQLFVLAPLVMIPLKNSYKYVKSLITILLIFSVLIPFYICYTRDLPYAGHVLDIRGGQYMIDYYMKTHCRYGVYILGIICGHAIYKFKKEKKEIKINKGPLMCLWIIVISTLLACIFGAAVFMTMEKNIFLYALWNATFRHVFSVAICALVLLCVTNNGGIINEFLSLPVFQMLTKVSYAMYLTHYSIQILRMTSETTIYMTHFALFFNFVGDFTLTFIASFICVILFEFPFMVIDKHVFGKGTSQKSENKHTILEKKKKGE